MCNLYHARRSVAEIGRLFDAEADTGTNVAGEVYPGYPGAVIVGHGAARVVRAMHWGFPFVAADARARAERAGKVARPRPVNNARSDKLSGPFWSRWFRQAGQRCLIPVDRFAEAAGEKGAKTRSWFHVPDQPMFAWAGLWRPSAEWGDCYSGVMVPANDVVRPLHDRMPAILAVADQPLWLSADADTAFALLRPWPGPLAVEATDELWVQR